MESLSRPFHRRKVSNANTFSGKNAYDGVFNGHRPKFDGVPAVNVEEYREIFSSGQADSSIPVLDLSTLEEASDGLNLEAGSPKPDYGQIFGGFRDQDIAVSYEELVARDKARVPSSTSQGSQDSSDLSHQSFNDLKQFNMSYNKINQRSKDALDETTHVTQLHAVPGFTCFIDEAASQLKIESEKQKSPVTNDVHFEKQASQSAVESRSKHHQDESLFGDKKFKTFKADLKSNPSEVSSSPAPSVTNLDKPKDYQKRPTAKYSDTHGDFPPCFDEELDVNSAAAASAATLRKAIEKAQETIRIAKESVGRKKEGLRGFSSKSFKDSLKVKSGVANVSSGEEQKEKDDKMKETFERMNAASQVFSMKHKHGDKVVFSNFADGEKLFGAKQFINEIHGKISESAENSEMRDNKIVSNSKEVVGETKAESIENNTYEASQKDDQRPNDYVVLESCEKKLGDTEDIVNNGDKVLFPYFADKLVGTKNLINEIHGKISESAKYSEMRDDKIDSNSKEVVGETKAESIENNTYEAPQKDNQRPNGYLVLESCEKKLGDTEGMVNNDKTKESKENIDEVRSSDAHKLVDGLDNLTVYKEVEDEMNISQESNQNGNEKRFSEELGLLENKKQEVLEQEHEEKVESENTECPKEEDIGEKFYDVCEVEMIESAQTYGCNLETNEVSPVEDCEMKEKENDKTEDTFEEAEIYENSSSDYDDAEESVSASHIVNDTQEACKVDQSQEFDDDDVSSSSAIEAEYKSEEKEMSENIYSDQTASNEDECETKSDDQTAFNEDECETKSDDQTAANEDECETKSDDMSNHGLADVDFGQNTDVQSGSSSDTIHGMEIEVKEYKETEETVKKDITEEEESKLQQSHEERPEISIKMETGTSQEPEDASRESGPNKVVEKEQPKRIKEVTPEERERERNRLVVERAIREARERAFIEARERAAVKKVNAEIRQRVMADKTSAQSKLKAERAAVERATAEARQRALEKAMSIKKTSEPRVQVNQIKQTSSSNCLQDLHISNGTSTESAKRSKAKLEKHNRIMERAAKALAEKEKRDMLALKEQAERSRLADNLDAEIKRWSSGKEGNLRALLSTLQYILGAESGWKAVSLTEIITTSAVKKAYRKATLCVHPDKVQQRGASIQQKYICEKVFDLLKAAWNRFNSEER